MSVIDLSGIYTAYEGGEKPVIRDILLFIIALSVALSLNIVGGLLIFVLLVTPASISGQFCFNVRSMFIVAPDVALFVSALGVWAGFEFTLPVAPLVALLLTEYSQYRCCSPLREG